MRQFQTVISLDTDGPALLEFTNDAKKIVAASKIATGVAHFFCQHTSASLLIQENADPDVQRDLNAFFQRLVPDGDPLFVHRCEGADDMPAHVKSALTQTTLTVPVARGALTLGTWQGLYLFEHRQRPHRRTIIVHLLGD